MDKDKFHRVLMEKLEEIRCDLIDIETALEKETVVNMDEDAVRKSQPEISGGYAEGKNYLSVNGRKFWFDDQKERDSFHARLLITTGMKCF